MSPTMVDAEPEPLLINATRTAVVMIDMQRDFLEPGGFGETLGNDVSLLAAAVGPCRALLAVARKKGMLIIHTREGHRPDLSDLPANKRWRSRKMKGGIGIGDKVDRQVLETIATASGGQAYFPEDVSRLDEPYRRIVEHLRQRWILAYTSTDPKRNGAWRPVEIRTHSPNAVVRSRGGYFAPEK